MTEMLELIAEHLVESDGPVFVLDTRADKAGRLCAIYSDTATQRTYAVLVRDLEQGACLPTSTRWSADALVLVVRCSGCGAWENVAPMLADGLDPADGLMCDDCIYSEITRINHEEADAFYRAQAMELEDLRIERVHLEAWNGSDWYGGD